MTNEEIVLNRLESKAKSLLHFKEPDRFTYYYESDFTARKNEFDELIKSMDGVETVKDRVYLLFQLGKNARTFRKNTLQCRIGANRSAQDIWRLYRYYFGEVDIFSIMRALYELSITDKKLGSYRCPTVRKQVFWLDNFPIPETHSKADLGVPLSEWKDIGLNQNEQTKAG